MSDVNTVTDNSFQQDVLSANGAVVVDFWATWCPPCRQMAPIFEELAGELAGKVQFVKLDVDENPLTAAKYGVSSIPTFKMFKDGQEVLSLVGGMPKAQLLSKINAAL